MTIHLPEDGVRQSSEQKVGLSLADPAFQYQTGKDQRASEPVPSRVRFLPQKTHTPFATSVDHTDARSVAGCGTDDCAE